MAVPILAIAALAQAAASGIGAISKGAKKKAALNEFENLSNNTPKYGGDEGISRYYNEALRRYNVSPTQSAMYKRGQQDVQRNLATGISGLQGLRSGLAGIPALAQQANDASLNNEVAAENEQGKRFSELGSATGMKNNDDVFKFKTNTIDPYQLKLSLASMKAGAATDAQHNATSNFYNSMGQAAQLYAMRNDDGDSGSSLFGKRIKKSPIVNTSPNLNPNMYGSRVSNKNY